MRPITHAVLGLTVILLVLSLRSTAQAWPKALPVDLVPIAEVPPSVHNWYSIQRFPWRPPSPCNWLRDSNVVLYISPSWGSNAVWVGDEEINYIQRDAEAEVLRLAARAANGRLSPDDNSETEGPAGFNYTTNDFWLEPISVASNLFNVILHGTTNGSTYLITSTEALNPLTNSLWLVEGTLQGGTNDATPFALGIATRTNSVFIRAQACDECATTALPLWWQLAYFGVTGMDPNADFDGDGVSNLQEYLNGTEPNKIAFITSFANDHVNANTVSGSIEVEHGIPVQMAILVDSTNFAAATWVSYNNTFSAALPTTDGRYQVWVGLRGFATDSQQSWDRTLITRDTQPPVLTTNAIPGTTSCPLMQLLGYCPEPLSSLSCNLSNAAGLATNQTVLVLDQYYDTNKWEFTTNYFQVFDLELTNGLNTVTLYATDLAGNASVSSFTFVLTNDTVPPVVTLRSPQSGQRLCGGTFTIDGWLDDPSASMQVGLVDSNGVTNTIGGLVERDGRFWVENLPLADGTNVLALTSTDAWGNGTTTNITVYKSALALAFSPIDPNQLFQQTISLSGTVSDPECTVWVNGVQAVNNGDGTWSAANVPFNSGGTASFAAAAYPTGQDLQADAASFDFTNLDLPDRLYVEQDSLSGNDTYDTTFVSYGLDGNPAYSDTLHMQTQYAHFWADDNGGLGGGSSEYTDSGPNGSSSAEASLSFSWPASSWPNFLPGDYIYEGDVDDYLWDFLVFTDTADAPTIGWEHCEVSDPRDMSGSGAWDGHPWKQTGKDAYTRHAQTKLKLFTGGKAIPGRKSLFVFRGGATELLDKRATPPFSAADDGFVHYLYACRPIPNQSVNIGGLGNLGADGVLYKVLPDLNNVDVTPKVPLKQFYFFNVTEQKCHPYIALSTATTSANLDTDTPEVCVGQHVKFELGWDSTPQGVVDTLQHWTLPAKYVNEPYDYSDTCYTYRQNGDLLWNNPTWCWYVNQPGGRVSMWQNLHFSNGQYASIAAEGSFTVYRPTVNPPILYGPYAASTTGDMLSLANNPMRFEVRINSKYPGGFGLTQLVNFYAQTCFLPPDFFIPYGTYPWGGFWLDGSQEYYSGFNDKDLANTIDDPPGVPLIILWANYNGHWKDYVRFAPAGGIAVTLGRLDWNWAASCIVPNPFVGWVITSDGEDGPILHDDDSFPLWSHVYSAPPGE